MYVRSLSRKPPPNWRERLGDYQLPPAKGRRRIWVHAVSVGEILASIPLLKATRSRFPSHEIILTCTTSSGHETAKKEFEKAPETPLYDHLFYFPIDLARLTLGAMQKVQPEVIVLLETELWMNFLWAAKVFDARVVIANGRISDRSYPRSKLIKFFYKALLKDVDRALMQTEKDANRIETLGFSHPEMLGNIKFDQAQLADRPATETIKAKFGLAENRPVLVIGSTRGEDEEKFVGEALNLLPPDLKSKLQIIHAPRHIERAKEVARWAESAGFRVGYWSKKETADYLVLDTYGDLAEAYGAADCVVIGGGFSKLGGQNLIQPLAWGRPIIHGPYMNNFADVASAAKEAGCSRIATSPHELAHEIAELIEHETERKRMGEIGLNLVQLNCGAVEKYINAISEEVDVYTADSKASKLAKPKVGK